MNSIPIFFADDDQDDHDIFMDVLKDLTIKTLSKQFGERVDYIKELQAANP